jgi:hypothetical protein
MKPNAKKYIRLDNQILSNRSKVDMFESGQFYNLTMRDLYRRKENEFIEKKQQIEKILTEEEKDQIEIYYGCGQMFEY